jgi:phytanoyl-CoA hydroxylase
MNLTGQKAFFRENGFVVVRGLFSEEETAKYRAHFMRLREEGVKPGDMVAETVQIGDPLKRYPRMIHMHRWDDVSRQWLLDPRLEECLTTFLEDAPLAVQMMLYFKPAGARGQALHQDNFYLKAQPGTCMAAWLALDGCDEENGCMRVVPGSHRWPILCTEKADTAASFTDVTVPLPPGVKPVPVVMAAGDVLFFSGSLVHGSYPNTSADRFRRALIGHYVEAKCEQLTKFDQPVLRMDGTAFEIKDAVEGGPCGVFVERDGRHEFAMADSALAGAAHE